MTTFAPYSNVNSKYVNVDSTNWPGIFGSKETGLQFGLPALRNNVQAANASQMKGGSKEKKTLRRKIKNIVKMYKMPRKNKHSLKKKLRSLYKKKSLKNKSRRTRTRSRSRTMSGGRYMQYQSDIPNTPSFSTGGILSAKDLGLANPVPYDKLPCTTNCVDNYNHYTNKGFQV